MTLLVLVPLSLIGFAVLAGGEVQTPPMCPAVGESVAHPLEGARNAEPDALSRRSGTWM